MNGGTCDNGMTLNRWLTGLLLMGLILSAGCSSEPASEKPNSAQTRSTGDLTEKDLFPVRKPDSNRIGFITRTGELVLSRDYHGYFMRSSIGGKVFLRDKHFFEGGRALVLRNSKVGFIDKTGRFVIEPQYDHAKRFSEGLAPVFKNNRWGFVDRQGDLITDVIFLDAHRFSEGLAYVETDTGWGFIDKTGNVQFTIGKNNHPYIQSFGPFQNGFTRVVRYNEANKTQRPNWYLNTDGETEFQSTFHESQSFSNGRATVLVGGRNGSWGSINTSGEVVIEPQFDGIGRFSEGLAPFLDRKDGAPTPDNERWGYINRDGEITIEARFTPIPGSFHDGLASVSRRNTDDKSNLFQSFYIDKQGDTVFQLDPSYRDPGHFRHGLASVVKEHSRGDLHGYITREGDFVFPEEWMY